jgi:hypothetical protein
MPYLKVLGNDARMMLGMFEYGNSIPSICIANDNLMIWNSPSVRFLSKVPCVALAHLAAYEQAYALAYTTWDTF